ncbi:MAG: hypothetical protein WC356_02915 [Candidatus Micrarchaeia archaeon]|jgi:hypothetical protein
MEKTKSEKNQIKRQALLGQLETEKDELAASPNLMLSCIDRLKRLLELGAPYPIIEREVQMIQYRALNVLSLYEAYMLCKWAYTDKRKKNDK